MVDSHAHLDLFAKNGTLGEVLARAQSAGVERIVACSTTPEEWSLYAGISKEFPQVAWQAGVHPTEIKDSDDIALDALPSLFAETPSCPAPVAVGEIGIDFHRLPADPAEARKIKDRQMQIFSRQLATAADLGAKVCVHARDAVRECIDAIERSGVPFENVVFHCFAGTPEELAELNERGARGSFTGVITYKNAEQMRRAMLSQPLELLMLETDCPYLAPIPRRGETCESAMLAITCAAAAELFGKTEKYMSALTGENAKNFFALR